MHCDYRKLHCDYRKLHCDYRNNIFKKNNNNIFKNCTVISSNIFMYIIIMVTSIQKWDTKLSILVSQLDTEK